MRLLAEAKERVGHGPWVHWIQREFGWPESAALKLMQLHEAFGAIPDGMWNIADALATAKVSSQAAQVFRDNPVKWDGHEYTLRDIACLTAKECDRRSASSRGPEQSPEAHPGPQSLGG